MTGVDGWMDGWMDGSDDACCCCCCCCCCCLQPELPELPELPEQAGRQHTQQFTQKFDGDALLDGMED